jgi:hypothetical protein
MRLDYEPSGRAPKWLDACIFWVIDNQILVSVILWLLIAIGVIYLWRF